MNVNRQEPAAQKWKEVKRGPYTIQQRARHTYIEESKHQPWINLQLDSPWFLASETLTLALWACYITYLTIFAHAIQTNSQAILWRMWLLVFAEAGLTLADRTSCFDAIMSGIFGGTPMHRPVLRLIGHVVPRVDVCVTACREDVKVIMDTVAAAAYQDYPTDRYRVFVLDDGQDDTLRSMVGQLNKTLSQGKNQEVVYLRRKKKLGVESFYKAGNIAFGLRESQALSGADLFAALDADMVPVGDWLRRSVPYLILDDGMAMLCPGQGAYNVPSSDPLAQFTKIFSSVGEPRKDSIGAACCSGSGYVVRRKAIDDIGGWPLVNVGEDIVCSYKLQGTGWRVGYIPDQLQIGLAPASMYSYIKQRMRWSDGTILVARTFRFFLPGASRLTSNMRPAPRIAAFWTMTTKYILGWLCVSVIVLPFVIWPTTATAAYTTLAYQRGRGWLRTLFLLSYVSSMCNRYLAMARLGLRNAYNHRRNRVWISPYIFWRIVFCSLPGKLNLKFEVTGSVISKANERSAIHRQNLFGRMLSASMGMHMTYVLYAAYPILMRLYGYYMGQQPSLFPFPGAMMLLVQITLMSCLPLHYMLFPPTVPERDALMKVDSNGISRPKERPETSPSNAVFWAEILEMWAIWVSL